VRGFYWARRAVLVVAATLVLVFVGAAAASPGDLGTSFGPPGTRTIGRSGFVPNADATTFEPGGGELLFAGLHRDPVTGKTDFPLICLHGGRGEHGLGSDGLVTIVLFTGRVSSVAHRSVG
jgi:hypothetical protein